MIHPSAKVIVRSLYEKDVLLLLKRITNGKTYYEPAGGKIEYSFESQACESFEQCAVREVKEEMGVSVDLKNYLGSFHFFWDIAPDNLSVCVVFEGILKGIDLSFIGNSDSCELPMEPEWVNVSDIISGKILINPIYVGLDKIILNYCLDINS